MNRIREGYVLTRNPYSNQITRFVLSPDIVDVIGFCTKNPHPMLKYLDEIKMYGQYWFVTITPYGKDIEPNVPDCFTVIEDFKKLSSIIGIEKVAWRYDPIFVGDKHSVEWHIDMFRRMSQELKGYTQTCVISFIDIYQKVEKNFPSVRPVTMQERLTLGKSFIEIAKDNDMVVKPCAEGDLLSAYGADCDGCMTVKTYELAIHQNLDVPKSKGGQRKDCACYLGADIGEYNTCLHLCKYCYANLDKELVMSNVRKHNPTSPLLIGEVTPNDVIIDASQESWITKQMRLDLM